MEDPKNESPMPFIGNPGEDQVLAVDGSRIAVKGMSFSDLPARLELIESNIEALPASICEAIVAAFGQVRSSTFTDLVGPEVFIPESNYSRPNKIYGGTFSGQSTGHRVHMEPFLLELSNIIQRELESKINFDEINKLRARVKELEEDLGYRIKVAKKLMEEPKFA